MSDEVFTSLAIINLVALGLLASRVAWKWGLKKFQPTSSWTLRLDVLTVLEVFAIFLGLIWAGVQLIHLLKGGDADSQPDVLMNLLIITLGNGAIVTYLSLKNRVAGGSLGDFGVTPISSLSRGLSILGLSLVFYLAFAPIYFGVSWAQEFIAKLIEYELPKQDAIRALEEDDSIAFNPLFLIGVCILTPILEEFVFRGFLYALCRRYLSALVSIGINASLFALIHDASRIQVLLLGGFLAISYERTRLLAVPICIHFWHNTLTVFAVHIGRLQGA